MKSLWRKAMLIAGALVVVTGAQARAAVVDVKVPFPFVVHGHQFPAGEYRVERDETNPSVILIRNEHDKTGMFVMTEPVLGQDPAGDRPALTFDRFENQYRLAGIWESVHQGEEVVPQK